MSRPVHPHVIDFLIAAITGRHEPPDDFQGADWGEIWTTARDHCIVPYLHERWSDAGILAAFPQHFVDRLARARARNSERNRRLAETLNEIHEPLKEAGIPVLLSKGLPVAQEYYGDPGLRVLYDLDLIVPSNHRSRTARILEQNGYQRYFPKQLHAEKEGELFWRPQTYAWSPDRVFEPDQPIFVELHTVPWARRWHGFNVECRLDLWAGHRELQLSGVTFRIPCPEKLLVHLAVHYAFNVLESNARLMHLLDIVLILQRRRDELDWDLVRAEIESSGVSSLCCIALALAEHLRGPCIPQDLRKRLWSTAPRGIGDWLRSRALRDIARVNVHNRDRALIYFLHWHAAATWPEKLRVLGYSCRAPLSEAEGGFSGWRVLAARMVHRVRHLARALQMSTGS